MAWGNGAASQNVKVTVKENFNMATTQTAQTTGAVASGVTNGQALANIEQASKPIPPRIAHPILVHTISDAAKSFKSAINLEVAVCLAVFAQHRGVSLAAKKELYSVYKEAGYECEVGGTGRDYKTVNRRLNYAGVFYGSLKGKVAVEDMMGDENRDQVALLSVINYLEKEYNFRSMNDVVAAAGVETPSAAAKKKKVDKPSVAEMKGVKASANEPPVIPVEQQKELPKVVQMTVDAAQKRLERGEKPTERQQGILDKAGIVLPAKAAQPPLEPDSNDKGVMEAMQVAGSVREQSRRETDNENWIRVTFAGAILIVPNDMAPEALGELGIKLMALANQMKGKKIDRESIVKDFAGEEQAAH
jgi:hypothetical protein